MIGTGFELLYYFTLDHDSRVKLGMTYHEANRLRERCRAKNLSEDTLAEYLSKLGCKIIRQKIIVPAVVRSKKGKLYTEKTLLTAVKASDYPEFDFPHIISRMGDGVALPDPIVLKRICRRGHFTMVAQRIELPSVWEYAPWSQSCADRQAIERIIGIR